MPTIPALTASGSRELKRKRPIIPPRVRAACLIMVYGRPDDTDTDAAPPDFIEAARLVGLHPDQMRRWLDRGEVRALLRNERKAFRASVCAGNELALRRVRDKSANGMCVVASVRQLEAIDQEDPHRRSGQESTPFMTIKIITPPASPAGTTIEHKPIEPEGDDPNDPTIEQLCEPRFRDPTIPR
jgi:hypothetical protein